MTLVRWVVVVLLGAALAVLLYLTLSGNDVLLPLIYR